MALSPAAQAGIDWLVTQLNSSSDLSSIRVEAQHASIRCLYLTSVSDPKQVQSLLRPFYELDEEGAYRRYLQSHTGLKPAMKREDLLFAIMQGAIVIACGSELYCLDVKRVLTTKISEATVESVIQGPQTGLAEDIETNLNLLRHRYHQPSLIVESATIGQVTRTQVALLYDRAQADPAMVDKLREQLANLELDVLHAVGQIQNYLTASRRSLFPVYMLTERPDRIIYNISVGKIIVLVQGTPFALVLPTVFQDFLTSMDDWNQPYWVGKFLQALRYFGLMVSTILPAMYVGVSAYNPEIFRVELALTIAGSRISVPYPAFFEVLFMLIMMELLTEASIRLPKTIGPTATTVGGLILGEAATSAGLVSNIMIIIVASVAIANFVIPINVMSFSIRTTKYLLLAVTTALGMVGLVMGVIGLIAYLVHLESFGQPFLKLHLAEDNPRYKGGKV